MSNANALLKRCFEAIRAQDMDVRLANAPTGKCTAPYAAIYEGAEETAGKCSVYRHVMVDVLLPRDQAAQLSVIFARVRAAMQQAQLQLVYAGQASILDEYEAICINADFRALCAR